MPLGAARLTLLAFQPTVAVEAEVIRKKQGIQAFGNAQIDTAIYKFGGSSADFDGSGDYVTASNTITLDGNFTIECWYRADSLPGSGLVPLFTFSDGHLFYIGYSGGNTVYDFYKAGSQVTLVPVTINGSTWYHAACVRSGSTISIYHNGTLNTTGTYSGTITATLDLAKYSTYYLDGHLDEVRISNTARYTSGFTPDTLPFVNDDNTKLLLHCDGSDGSTYFDDDNGVRGIIPFRAFGNAQIDTSRSVFGGSSLLLDGTGDYIKHIPVPATGPFYKMNQTFTAECWFNKDTDTGDGTSLILSIGDGSGGSNYAFSLAVRNFDNKIQVVFYPRDDGLANTQAIFYTGSGSATIVDDTWNHFAVAGNGSNFSIWLNGTRVYTVALTNANGVFGADGSVTVGANFNGGLSFNQGGNGWMDEVRISTVDRYGVGNSSITVPTAPFVNDANTLLLLHMDGTDGSTLFLDDNGDFGTTRTAIEVTANGNAQIDTAQNQFGGASAYFDGTGDYLLTGSAISLNGTGDFTVECWFRTDDASTSASIIDFRVSGSTNPAPIIYFASSNVYWFAAGANRIQSGAGGTAQTTISANTWYHIAVVRSSGSTKMYINGTNVGVTYADSNNYPSNIATIGENYVLSAPYGGHIDEFRISDTVRYTANFTAPTNPFKNDANTLLLLHMDGADGSTTFTDDNKTGRAAVGIKAIGNGHTETSQSKFGGTSYEATNQGNYLDLDNFGALGNGDWTLEAFVRFKVLSGAQMVFDWRPTSQQGAYPTLYVSGSSLVFYQSSGSRINSGAILSTNTWYHFALCKSGNSTKLFVDGTQVGSTYTDNNTYLGERLRLFGDGFSAGNATLDGFVDELRISKSARYTENFTPTTESFQNDANTLLLLHMDGTDGDTDFVDDNGKESA